MVRALVLAAIASFSASLATAAERDQREACEALEPIIAAYATHAASGEALNFSAGQALPIRDWDNAATLTQASGWHRSAPSAETIRRLSEVTPANAMACPNFARQASVLGRVLTDDQRQAVYRSRGGAPRARVQVVTMPVIDKSGQEGLVKVRVQRNGLGQVENLYYLRKTKTGWRISGEREPPPQDLRPLG